MKKILLTLFIALQATLALQAQGPTPIVPTILFGCGGSFSSASDSVEVFGYNENTNVLTKYFGISDNAITGLAGNNKGEILVSSTNTLSFYKVINNRASLVTRLNTLAGIRNPIFINDSVCAGLFGFGVSANTQTLRFYTLPELREINIASRITEQTGSAFKASNNKLFVTIPGSFPSTQGKVAVVNLNNFALDTIINFGPALRNLDKIVSEADSLYLPTSLSFGSTNGNLAVLNINNLNARILTFSHPVEMLASVRITPATNQTILLGKFNQGNNIDELRLGNGNVPEPIPNWNKPYMGLFSNGFSNTLYAANTDYSTFGKIFRYNTSTLQIQDSLTVGVSPEQITAFAYPIVSSLEANKINFKLNIYPQPANDFVFISGADLANHKLVLSNTLGQQVELPIYNNQVETKTLQSGLYIAHIEGFESFVFKLVIKK